MIAGVIANTDIKGTPEFIKNVVMDSTVKPDLDSDMFDTHFAGNYAELSELLTEIIVFNKFTDLVKKNISQLIVIIQAKS